MIAIIAILAAILFPVFAKAREAARKATCQSNLKQIGLVATDASISQPAGVFMFSEVQLDNHDRVNLAPSNPNYHQELGKRVSNFLFCDGHVKTLVINRVLVFNPNPGWFGPGWDPHSVKGWQSAPPGGLDPLPDWQ